MKILFMCVANSARSQLAEGLAKHLLPKAEIRSAGSHPGVLNPYAVKVLDEKGIDITKQYSKSTDDLPKDFLAELDYVITLCEEEVCRVILSNAKKIHWPLPDPASNDALTDEERVKRFRWARDMITHKLNAFKEVFGG